MRKIDFSYLKKKHRLSANDIVFLNEFFNQDEIFNKLAKINEDKNEILRKFLIMPIIIVFIFVLAFAFNSERLIGISVMLFLFGMPLSAIVIDNFIDELKFDFKGEILSPLALKINSDLKYDTGGQHYFGEENYMGKIGLLRDYDGIFRIEDSIEYSPKIIDEKTKRNIFPFGIQGYEIVTYVKDGINKNGLPKYQTNNHCYLTKVTFNNMKDVFSEGLLLKHDVSDNIFQKLYMSFFIFLIILSFAIYIILPVIAYISVNLNLLKGITINDIQGHMKNWLPIISAIAYYYIYVGYSKYIQKGRIKLENIEFERKFDAYHSSNVKSRELLTPGFMYKLVDYVNKVDSKRAYEFYFVKNVMYIKIEYIKWRGFDFFHGEFLNVGVFKNVLKNLEQIIIFYRDFNNLVQLSNDLGLEYLNKEAINNNIIK